MAVAMALETIDDDRPAELGEALALGWRGGHGGGQPATSARRPRGGLAGHVRAGRCLLPPAGAGPGPRTPTPSLPCRGGGRDLRARRGPSGEQGDLLAVGVGPARLLKVPKADLLRLSLESDWRRDVAALVDDWVDRISRATATGDPPGSMAFLERDEPHQAAAGVRCSARREVLWVRPGPAGIRFIDRVSVPTCPHEFAVPALAARVDQLQPSRNRPSPGTPRP